jgi:hypothetical protein
MVSDEEAFREFSGIEACACLKPVESSSVIRDFMAKPDRDVLFQDMNEEWEVVHFLGGSQGRWS